MAQMIESPTFLAVIPARGGSKGLPDKNILDAAGKPLVAWTIEAALNARSIDKTVVTSDDERILEVAKKQGAETIKRPKELADDTTATEPVLCHAIDLVEASGERYDYLVLLQPTSPARDASDIDRAIQKMLDENASSVISVYEPDRSPLHALKLNEKGSLVYVVNDAGSFKRRQDLPKTYMPNGAIYIVGMQEFKKNGSLFTDRCIPFIMPVEKSIDIDTSKDLLEFLRFLKTRHEKD